MRLRKGIPGVRYLKPAESGIVESVTARAATPVARGQKKPSRKITHTPGLMKPVYSWMYWIAWSNRPSWGARRTAIPDDTKIA